MNCDCMRLRAEMERKRMSEARGKREKRSRIISETLTDDAIWILGNIEAALDFGGSGAAAAAAAAALNLAPFTVWTSRRS